MIIAPDGSMLGNDVTVGNDVTKGHDVAKSNEATVSSNATADDQVSLSAGVSAGDDVVDGQSTPDDRRANNGSQNVNYPGGGFSEVSVERMEQVEVLKTCFKMEWSGMSFVSSVIQITSTNNKTQEKLTFSVDSRDSTLMVCDLQEHQSYKVQLSDPGWQSGRGGIHNGEIIGLKIFAVDFDWNKGPFSGFNLRIMKSKSLDEVGRQRTEGRYRSNFKLTKDTEYEIYVGTVSTVAHITTHAFVSVISATTSLINIHVIVMFLCFVVGIVLLAYTITFVLEEEEE
ncbi:hypothetical protein Btru_077608 [Bulinus truncatus]|nr:hypothetical protein Btru_077608 [Bulinus truncatus]